MAGAAIVLAANSSTLDLSHHITYHDAYRRPVASGGYSDIYRAEIDGMLVAVKVMRDIDVQGEEKKASFSRTIEREMRIWSKINHENVLAFLGFCFFPTPLQDGTTLLSLVSPWMKNGTVVSYIRQHPEVDRLDIIWGVLRGLKCLHGKGIVHGDIKGGNVFMTDQGTPVLADFGLASLAENEPSLNPTHESVTSRTTGNLRGSPRWMAPELLGTDSSPKSTFATDVWAYGCLILEIMNLVFPYANYRTDIQAMMAIMQHRPPYEFPFPDADNLGPPPMDQHPGLWTLCLRCWDFDPTTRIQVEEIARSLVPIRFPVQQFFSRSPRPRPVSPNPVVPSFPRSPPPRAASPAPIAPSVSRPPPPPTVQALPVQVPTPPRPIRIPSPQLPRRVATPPPRRPSSPPPPQRSPPQTAYRPEPIILPPRAPSPVIPPPPPPPPPIQPEQALPTSPIRDPEIAAQQALLRVKTRTLGEKHPDTLTCMHALVVLYYSQKRHEEAEKLARVVIEGRTEALSKYHYDTLTSMHQLELIYYAQYKYKEAEELGKETVESKSLALGEEHPSTISSMFNLAVTYTSINQFSKANELYAKVIEFRKERRGEDDVETLSTVHQHVLSLEKEGRLTDAATLGADVTSRRRRVLGDDDADTRISMEHLMVTYIKLGRTTEAEELERILSTPAMA